MDIQACIDTIAASKNYKHVCMETIARVTAAECGKYKSPKEAVKSAKTILHQITGAFVDEASLKKGRSLLEDVSLDTPRLADGLLSLHVSSAERETFGDALFADIRDAVGEGDVLDIACGLNPCRLGRIPGFGGRYYASDIHTGLIDLLNGFFARTGLAGEAFSNDILYRIPDMQIHNVLLFKILPLLEQQRKGYSRVLIDSLRSDCFTVTFPTRSLSGRNVGMAGFYDSFMRTSFPETAFDYRLEKEYPNEKLYIITRR